MIKEYLGYIQQYFKYNGNFILSLFVVLISLLFTAKMILAAKEEITAIVIFGLVLGYLLKNVVKFARGADEEKIIIIIDGSQTL